MSYLLHDVEAIDDLCKCMPKKIGNQSWNMSYAGETADTTFTAITHIKKKKIQVMSAIYIAMEGEIRLTYPVLGHI